MPYDVAAFRARFPALAAGYAHFDGPGGSQVPVEVAQAVAMVLGNDYMTGQTIILNGGMAFI